MRYFEAAVKYETLAFMAWLLNLFLLDLLLVFNFSKKRWIMETKTKQRTTLFEREIVEMESSLNRYAYSLTMNVENAKDLTQETIFKALNNKDKFDDQTNIKAWLYTIMKNTFINEYRRKAKRSAIFSSEVQEYVINNKPAHSNPESDYNYKELNSIVMSLDDEFRIPFQMHEEGYKYQEIADELGLNLGTVKSRIHFSRKKMMSRVEA